MKWLIKTRNVSTAHTVFSFRQALSQLINFLNYACDDAESWS